MPHLKVLSEHLTWVEQTPVVMCSMLCLKHCRRFFPPYGGLSDMPFQCSYFFFFSQYFLFKRKIIIKQKWNVHSYDLVIMSPVMCGPLKNSYYRAMHIFLIKYSKVKPCLKCGKRSKLQICNPCGANKVRVNDRYHTVIKPLTLNVTGLETLNIHFDKQCT